VALRWRGLILYCKYSAIDLQWLLTASLANLRGRGGSLIEKDFINVYQGYRRKLSIEDRES